jgi:probable F420-dependent oxidoreductase
MQQSFGIRLPGLVPRYAPTFAELPDLVADLERMGFDDVVDGEHILFAPEMHHPGGGGDIVHGRDRQRSDRADSIVMFAAIAAKTTRLQFVSSVMLAAAHGFAVLARQAATLDVLSRGRFVLGVGPGWFAGEFAAQGISPKERDERLEEVILACRELWSAGPSTFDGRWIHFADVISEPAPFTTGGVPVWWGGNALKGPTARRVATIGAGWLSREAADYDELARSIEALHAACAAAGRDPAEIGVRASLTPTDEARAVLDFDARVEQAITHGTRLGALGVTHFTLPLSSYRLDLAEAGKLLEILRAA